MKNSINSYLSLILFIICSYSTLFAEVRLPNIIGDHMVLQQGTPIRIWGWADVGENVTVTFSDQKKTIAANSDGEWSIFLDSLEYGGPFEMIISGKNTIKFSNILVGEVWVSSGQSNMEWALALSENAETEILQSTYPNVRLFKVGKKAQSKPADDVMGLWTPCEPAYASGFSAVAYHFGTELYRNLKVPIGLIDASWGGSAIEPWMEINTLKSKDEFDPIIEKWEECLEKYESMEKIHRMVNEYVNGVFEYRIASKINRKNKAITPQMPPPLECKDCVLSPGGMFNGMIAPITPFKIRGIIWYQGESNVPRANYQELFPTMIELWRAEWDLGDFPFLFVQLAPFAGDFYKEDKGSILREAQLKTYLDVPNTGMAVTMDIGNIHDIHPRNKKEVGRRLSLWALADTYSQKGIVKSGPIYKSMTIENRKIRIKFDFSESGLEGQNEDPKGFEIAGKDLVYVPASCEIVNGSVLISAESIKNPIAVRYGWGKGSLPTLFNKEGLPASPFNVNNLSKNE